MNDSIAFLILTFGTLLFIFTSHENEKIEAKVVESELCEKSTIEIPDENAGISMVDVKPTQWFLPEQVKTPRYSCKKESDWPDDIKCPSHHPYIWSRTNSIKRVTTPHSKYGTVQCSVSIICSNIYDADAVGVIWSN